MSSTNRSGGTSAANEVLVPPAETVRACTDRQRRLTEYIRGHTGANIAVRLTQFVPTACVMPTSREKLVDSNNADFSPEEAERQVESVDADYLVLISTAPATTERLPISDQLTADRAQQFGYALHELGHIRYTAIAASASMIRERVEKGHQAFVKGIWNSCEDAAIENQLAVDQSQLAADRLEIVNRSISKPAEEFSPEHPIEFSFRDAIEAALYDRGIYNTGVNERLCDSEDEQFVFVGDADRQAFAVVDDSIDSLLGTILTTPNSIDRAEAVMDWWETELEPLLSPPEQDENEDQQQGAQTQSGSPSQDSAQQDRSRDSSESSMDQQGQENETQQDSHGENSDNYTGSGEEADQRPDPSEINTDQRQESPGSDTLEYPDIGGEKDADALEQPGEGEVEGLDSEGENTGSEGDAESSEEKGESESASDSDSETTQDSESNADSSSESKSSSDPSTSSESEPEREQMGGGGESEDSDSEGEAMAEGSKSPSEDDGSIDESTSETTDGGAGDSPSDNPDGSSGSGQEESNANTNGGEGATEDTSPDSSASNPWLGGDSTQTQSSLGSFGDSEDQSPADTDECPPESNDTPQDDSESKNEGTGSTAGSSSNERPEGESKEETDDTSSGGSAGRDSSDDPIELGDNPSTSGSSQSEEREDADESNQPTEESRTNESDKQDGDQGVEGNQDNGDQENDTQESEESTTPAPSPAHEGSDLESSDALDADRRGARNEADDSTPDESSLERDLEDAKKALENLNEDEEADGEGDGDEAADGGSQDSSQGDGGSGATPGSLDELSIMPTPDSSVADSLISERFQDAETDADYTAGALRKALKQNRRSGTRSGLTSGSFDRRRAAALARGEVNVFQVTQQGEEKKYDLVLILDRSISMRHAIGTAEDAMVRFAIACEDIGINVGILDFYQNEARLVKPFSVETQFVQSSLLSGDREGGTPLSDALNIGRELLDQRSNSPLVLIVTDGKPGDADAYQDVLSNTYGPVCGLTLCLERASGNIPERVSQNERFYDRHMYVHDTDKITDRLEQFAVMFNGL